MNVDYMNHKEKYAENIRNEFRELSQKVELARRATSEEETQVYISEAKQSATKIKNLLKRMRKNDL